MGIFEDILLPSVPDGKILYHYTPQDGLREIVESKELWASSILHLNDAAEFNYTLQLVQECLRQRVKKQHGYWDGYYEDLEIGVGNLEARTMTTFVGSFSERGDLLSQWRAYTNNGIGFSLGFEYDHLKSCADRQTYVLPRCNYDKVQHNPYGQNSRRARCPTMNLTSSAGS